MNLGTFIYVFHPGVRRRRRSAQSVEEVAALARAQEAVREASELREDAQYLVRLSSPLFLLFSPPIRALLFTREYIETLTNPSPPPRSPRSLATRSQRVRGRRGGRTCHAT